MSEDEKINNKRVVEAWSSSFPIDTEDMGDFEFSTSNYLTGRLEKDGIFADLRLHKSRDRGYMIYVNYGSVINDNKASEDAKVGFVNMIVELVKKLRLEGVDITWVNIQHSLWAGELGKIINDQIGIDV